MTGKEKNEAIEYLKSLQNRCIKVKGDKIGVDETSDFWILEDIIRELKKETVSRESYENEYNLRKICETEILHLEGIIRNQWIYVEENLPEEHCTVLVYCPQQKNIYCACRNKNEWKIFGKYGRKLEVVAWRPLPTAPSYNLCDTNPFNDERFGG